MIPKRLLSEIKQIRVSLALVVLVATTMGFLIVVQAATLTKVLHSIFLAKQTPSSVLWLLVILPGIFAVRALLTWVNSIIMARAAATVKASLRERLVEHLQKLGPAFTTNERSGELAATIGEGVEALDAFLSQTLPQIGATCCIPLVLGLVVFLTDPLSGVILLVTTPILFFFLFLVGVLANEQTKKQWKQLSHMSAHFLDVLQGLTTLKLFGRSEKQQEVIGRVSERFRETTMKVLRVAFLSALVLELGATLSTALVAVEIGLRLLYSQLSFQIAFFVLLLTPDFYAPLRTLGAKFHASMSGSAAVQRIYEILDTPVVTERERAIEDQQREAMVPVLVGPSLPALHFRDVVYAYRDRAGDEHPALRGVSFILEPGQKIALVGASGAGKSTIAHLLLRFIEPQQGEIVIGDTPLATLDPRAWRERIAWVPQRPALFSGSLAENIRLGRAGATMEDVIEAARQAGLHEFICSLPRGYETAIGERGARLSGGQAQRLALARVFLKDAPLLILDEATAHLDRENEQIVLDALSTFMEKRMALIITHHPYPIQKVDHVIVLDEGRVTGSGSRETTLFQSTMYQRLFALSEKGGVA